MMKPVAGAVRMARRSNNLHPNAPRRLKMDKAQRVVPKDAAHTGCDVAILQAVLCPNGPRKAIARCQGAF